MLDGQSEPNSLWFNSYRQDDVAAPLDGTDRAETAYYSVPAELVLRLVNAVRRVASGIDSHIHIVSQQFHGAPAGAAAQEGQPGGRADEALPQIAESLEGVTKQIARLSEIARAIAARPPVGVGPTRVSPGPTGGIP